MPPRVSNGACRIRVDARDADLHRGFLDASDGNFGTDLLRVSQYDFSHGAGSNMWAYGSYSDSWAGGPGGQRLPADCTTPVDQLQAGAYARLAFSTPPRGIPTEHRYENPLPGSGNESTLIAVFRIAAPRIRRSRARSTCAPRATPTAANTWSCMSGTPWPATGGTAGKPRKQRLPGQRQQRELPGPQGADYYEPGTRHHRRRRGTPPFTRHAEQPHLPRLPALDRQVGARGPGRSARRGPGAQGGRAAGRRGPPLLLVSSYGLSARSGRPWAFARMAAGKQALTEPTREGVTWGGPALLRSAEPRGRMAAVGLVLPRSALPWPRRSSAQGVTKSPPATLTPWVIAVLVR